MSAYANLASAKLLLGLDDADPDDADKIVRLGELDAAMSRLFDLKTGRTFGIPADTPDARDVPGTTVAGEAVLVLPVPVRSVTDILIVGDWAEEVEATEYALDLPTQRGDYLALRKIAGGGWPAANGRSTITVTGVWSDQADGEAVPIEVVEAVTFLVVEHYRLETSSPAGEIGPEGMTIRPRNPWRFEIVETAITRYKVALPVASF